MDDEHGDEADEQGRRPRSEPKVSEEPAGSRWGKPPDPIRVARILAERYLPERDEKVAALVHEEGIEAVLSHGGSRIAIRVDYLSGAGPDRDPWMLITDSLDSLFAMLIESGRAYRDLPSGDGVDFQGALLRVTVEHTVPELDKIADQLLAGHERPPTPRGS